MRYDQGKFEVIVVDDDDDAETRAIVESAREAGSPVKYVSQYRRGAAHARNRGAAEARYPMLLFCDDDILVERDHLTEHARAHRGERPALVNGTWRFASETMRALESTSVGRLRLALEERFRGLREENARPLEDIGPGCYAASALTACNLSVERGIFAELGGFDEAFRAVEDQELGLRAGRCGCQLVLSDRIMCLHDDRRVTLRELCGREEAGARGTVMLLRKYPEVYAEATYFVVNGPIRRGDRLDTVIKKLVKSMLARRVPLAVIHAQVSCLERVVRLDWVLWPVYQRLLGLHIFRGFRSAVGPGGGEQA